MTTTTFVNGDKIRAAAIIINDGNQSFDVELGWFTRIDDDCEQSWDWESTDDFTTIPFDPPTDDRDYDRLTGPWEQAVAFVHAECPGWVRFNDAEVDGEWDTYFWNPNSPVARMAAE